MAKNALSVWKRNWQVYQQLFYVYTAKALCNEVDGTTITTNVIKYSDILTWSTAGTMTNTPVKSVNWPVHINNNIFYSHQEAHLQSKQIKYHMHVGQHNNIQIIHT